MENFSKEKARDMDSTDVHTSKFCIGVDANGCCDTRGDSVNVEV